MERKWKILEVRMEGKHLWNSRGSEARKSEKKRTGDQAGENGENRRSESRNGALRKLLRGGGRKKGKRRNRG